jgi:hypothetical protein
MRLVIQTRLMYPPAGVLHSLLHLTASRHLDELIGLGGWEKRRITHSHDSCTCSVGFTFTGRNFAEENR